MTNQPVGPRSTSCAGGLPGELAQIRGRVRDVGNTLLAARSRGELMDTVAEIEALKSTLDALELGVVRELDVTRGVQDSGWASTQDFVTSVAGGTKGSGPSVVRLATAVESPVLAPVAEALGDGWLSTAKAQVIERAVDALPGNPGLRGRGVLALLAEARSLDATELKKVANRLLTLVDPDGAERRDEQALDRLERAAHLNRFLTITDDQAGGAWIKARCSSEDAALIKTTLIPLAKPEPRAGLGCDAATCRVPGCGHGGRDPRDHGARMLDAWVETCRRLQTANVLPEAHGAVPRLTLTMNLTDLRSLSGFGVTETGEQLSASAIRRLCCDADVIPAVLGGCSEVLDVGRRVRLASTAIWKAIVARDVHCRFTGCTRPPIMCHAHHIEHWIDGGETSLHNLILLCGHHHRLIHAGPWKIRRAAPNGFVFDPPPGTTRQRTGRPRPND